MGIGGFLGKAFGKVGKLFGITSIFGWIGLGIGALIAGFTVVHAKKVSKQLAQDRLNTGIREVHPSQSGSVIPIVYGRASTDGILVYTQVGSTLSNVPSSDIVGSLTGGSSKRNSYLLAQWVLSVDGVTAIRDVHIEGDSIASVRLANTAVVALGSPGVPSDMATAFSDERTSSSKFAGAAHATCAFFLDVRDPKYSGIPYPTFFLDGIKLKNVTLTGSTYSLSLGETFRYEPPLVLLDYLTHEQSGPRIPLAQIDLETFYLATSISSRKVLGPQSDIWDDPYPVRDDDYGEVFPTWREYFNAHGFTDKNQNGLIASAGIQTPGGLNLLRHEFHGLIPTDETYHDVIAGRILPTMPGAILAHGVDGKYKLRLPDPEVSVDTVRVATIDDSVLVDAVTVTYPGADVRRNRLVVRYASANKDYALDSVAFPTAGSTLHTSWLAADGDRPIEETVNLPHTLTREHACSIAANQIILSRRTLYRGVLTFDALLYEPGDVVRLKDERMGVDADVRLLDIQLREDQTVSFEAIGYDPADYDWYVDDAETIASQNAVEFIPNAPLSATTTFDKINGIIKVEWTMPSIEQFDVGITHFEIQETLAQTVINTPVVDQWATVAHPTSDDLSWSRTWVPLEDANIKHRIRSVSI